MSRVITKRDARRVLTCVVCCLFCLLGADRLLLLMSRGLFEATRNQVRVQSDETVLVVMEWREQSAVGSDEAYLEARRWIEAATEKAFGSEDFRAALENGVLLCDLINRIKPGTIRRVNRLPTPIAGLDNLNVFLKAGRKLGLKEAQLFHPGDLQDLSTRVTVKHQETNRRLKNVLITIFWLGRRAQCERGYDGPHLNLKAFEGLLGTALFKALQESSSQKGGSVRDSGFGDSWYSEREEVVQLRGGGGGRGGHRRDDSLDSLDSLGSRPRSISSDATLKGGSEGCCSDAEADAVLRMDDNRSGLSYRRSVTITPKASGPFNQFLPTKDKVTGYVPAPLRKKRAERQEDSRRSWVGPAYSEEEGTLSRQRTESVDGSKSTSDILVERQDRYEELQKFREQTKETEDQWQDDLSKWKNRRRSVNSDIVKKKEERDEIEQITSGGGRRSKTFKEMQEERETKGRNSIGGRLGSLSYLDDEDVFNAPVVAPRTRTLPARSYTIDTPYSSSEPPEPVLKEADPPSPATASPAPPPAPRGSDTVDRPAGRDATTAIGLRSAAPAPPHRSPERTVKTEASSTAASLEKEPRPRLPLSRTQPEAEAPSSGFLHKQPPPPQQQTGSMEARPPGVSRVSASLPRSYQRSDSARLTSVVAPRPFGAQSSRLTPLPRALTVDDPQKRVNGDGDVSRKSAVPSRYHQFMTSEDEAHSQTSSARSTEDEEEEEEVKTAVKTVSPVKPEAPVGPAPPKETSQENCREMRISLNQKPNSSKDFGFQAVWDSTGARVTSIQPGSPAEMCQLQVGDEVLTLNGQQVADMSYVDWKSSMEEALQEGSLIIDIRHRGNNNWDRDPTSLPFKSHKTINLTSTDHPILLGSHDNNVVGSSLDFTSRRSTAVKPLPPVQEAAARPLLDAASNGVNGGFREPPVTLRNKESEPISLKNLKRRSEFFEKGGSESVMPDIPVPPLTLTSSRWSWDPEEERKRQEKWQKEQERILQEKYKRDQEKLQEEWLKDQEEIARSTDPLEPVSLEVNRHIISPHSPRSPLNQPPWEEEEEEEEERKREEEEEERQRKVEEERQRQEEVERQRQVEVERQRQAEVERQRQAEVERQRQAEERRKREEEARELQRLREERQRKERQEEEERKMVAEEELRWQKRREEEREAERRRQEAAEQQRRDQWMKSKSCSQLDEEEAPQRKVTGGGGLAEKKGLQSGSHAELERQQILNDMKKKTPLLMDRSWIRQRSAAAEPDAGGVKESDMPPIRRGESLDNLDSYNSWRSSWTPRTSSVSHVQNYARPHSALSGAPRPGSSSTLPSSSSMGSLRGGAGNPSFPWSQQSSTPSSTATSPEPTSEGPQQRSRSVSGKKICTFCDAALGKGAAMIIESLGLCYHLGCFKCIDCKSDLGGSQAGAEVRIRNKQLFCNSCYVRFKAGQPTSM